MTAENTTPQNYNLRQTMLSFAYLAYTGEELTTPNPEAGMGANITAALPQISIGEGDLSSWHLVWGPVAYTIPGALYQDNMMYVVQNGTTSQYVIAVRGTNFTSQVDWFLEDFEVIDTMPWPMPRAQSSCAPDSAISESTSIAMNILLGPNMTDPSGGQLLAFLSGATKNGAIHLCLTGHSLGGQLSNTLGLYLLENPSFWDASGSSTVSCISFASPTAGNALYATNANNVYAAAFSKGTFPGWDPTVSSNLDNLACNMDGAPLLYSSASFYSGGAAGSLFSLYSSPNNPTDNINFGKLSAKADAEWGPFQSIVLNPLANMVAAHDYTQLSVSPFQGQFNGSGLVFGGFEPSLVDYLGAFAAQAGWQHSCSYPIYLNVPSLFNPTIVVRSANYPPAIPKITSISPDIQSNWDKFGKTVTITGSGFVAGSNFGNYILFSDPTNRIGYMIDSVTDTEIIARFYVHDLQAGVQNVFVVTSSPYYTSNSLTFTIKGL